MPTRTHGGTKPPQGARCRNPACLGRGAALLPAPCPPSFTVPTWLCDSPQGTQLLAPCGLSSQLGSTPPSQRALGPVPPYIPQPPESAANDLGAVPFLGWVGGMRGWEDPERGACSWERVWGKNQYPLLTPGSARGPTRQLYTRAGRGQRLGPPPPPPPPPTAGRATPPPAEWRRGAGSPGERGRGGRCAERECAESAREDSAGEGVSVPRRPCVRSAGRHRLAPRRVPAGVWSR